MGCDMHCVVEARNKKTGNWECFGVSTAIRYYVLFSRIADVRNSEKEDTYIEPIDIPRGLPEDASNPAKVWYSKTFYYPATWLCRTELESLNKWLNERGQDKLWNLLGFDELSFFFNLEGSWDEAAFTNYDDLRVLFFFRD